jgi:hypothetical protein
VHDVDTRRRAIAMLELGLTRRDVCRILGIGYNSTYRWEKRLEPWHRADVIPCFRCADEPPGAPAGYVYLLGQYLGDGHIRRNGRSLTLSIFCCNDYPRIMADVSAAMASALGAGVFDNPKTGCVAVESTTRHWACLFPQHGPGMKHTRPIVLEPWQQELVDADPRPLIRGLIHSDGCRVTNWTERQVGGTTKRYTYPRYFFSNASDDIRRIFTDALDQLGIAWRQSNARNISIARREAVAALDEFVGPKR